MTGMMYHHAFASVAGDVAVVARLYWMAPT
jgi:hypothetical protein